MLQIRYPDEQEGYKTVLRSPTLVKYVPKICSECGCEIIGDTCEACGIKEKILEYTEEDVKIKEQIKLYYKVQDDEEDESTDHNDLYRLNQIWRENKAKLDELKTEYAEKTGTELCLE